MKRWIHLLALMCTSPAIAAHEPQAQSHPSMVITDLSELPIATPALAQRRVRKLQLQNGLRVFLISDPGASESAAAVGVQAGGWDDPQDAPGLAHFVEHMVFMGSSAFPGEDDFQQYINQFGGSTNAFTANDRTVYGFGCKNEGLEGSLQRLGAFLDAPLFNTSSLERERQAVDQEYRRDINFDVWRSMMIEASLSNPQHPHSRYSIGSRDGLAHITSDALQTWFAQHYSANLMSGVVYSPLPLDRLQAMVEHSWGSITNRQLTAQHLSEPLMRADLRGTRVTAEPLSASTRDLRMVWELPNALVDAPQTWPAQVAAQVLSSEAPGSLMDQLKSAGLATGMGAWADHKLPGNSSFTLVVQLTDEGVRQVDAISQRVFATLATLRHTGVTEAQFKQLRDQWVRQYTYQNRSAAFGAAMQHAQHLVEADLATYPDPVIAPRSFDAEATRQVFDLLRPGTAQYGVMAPRELTQAAATQFEPQMHVPYRIDAIAPALLAEWDALLPSLAPAAAANPFLPENLEVLPLDATSPTTARPAVLLDDDSGTVYYARDVDLLTPQVVFALGLVTPLRETITPRQGALGDLYNLAAQDALSATLYQASEVGLNGMLAYQAGKLSLSVSGYSDKALVLLDALLATARNLQTSDAKFAELVTTLQRHYTAFGTNGPVPVALDVGERTMSLQPVATPDKLTALQSLRPADLQAFARQLLERTHTQGILYGNLDEATAYQVATRVQRGLSGAPYAQGRDKMRTWRDIRQQQATAQVQEAAPCQGNAVMLLQHVGPFTPQAAATSQVLEQALQERFFDELRTRQQTGYLVRAMATERDDQIFYVFIVEPQHHGSTDVLGRVESFIAQFSQQLGHEVLTEADFNLLKAARLSELRAPPRNLTEGVMRLNDAAFNRNGNLQWRAEVIDALDALTYGNFLDWSRAALDPTSPRRVAVLVDGSKAAAPADP